jgi:hypothetical protein
MKIFKILSVYKQINLENWSRRKRTKNDLFENIDVNTKQQKISIIN